MLALSVAMEETSHPNSLREQSIGSCGGINNPALYARYKCILFASSLNTTVLSRVDIASIVQWMNLHIHRPIFSSVYLLAYIVWHFQIIFT